MTRYGADVRTEGGAVFRWRLEHQRLRIAKKRREKWLHTNGRLWDVHHAGRHDNWTKLAQREPEYAVRLEGWRKLGPRAYFNSRWDMYSGDLPAPSAAPPKPDAT